MKKLLTIFLLWALSVSSIFAAQAPLDVHGNPIVFREEKPPGEADWTLINTVMKNYETNLVQAINTNRFSLVEPYLVKGSSLYSEQKELVRKLYLQGIKETLKSYEIMKYELISSDEYRVFVTESVEIKYPNKPGNIKDFQWIYTFIKSKNGLSKIEKWTHYQSYIDQLMGSVKASGYYAGEMMDNYALILLEAINTLNITRIKQISASNEVLEKQKQLIIKLRGIGSDFEIDVKKVLDCDYESWKEKILIIFAYRDKAKQRKTINVTLALEFDEIRKGYYGDAVITRISVLD